MRRNPGKHSTPNELRRGSWEWIGQEGRVHSQHAQRRKLHRKSSLQMRSGPLEFSAESWSVAYLWGNYLTGFRMHTELSTVPNSTGRVENLLTHRLFGRVLRGDLPNHWGNVDPEHVLFWSCLTKPKSETGNHTVLGNLTVPITKLNSIYRNAKVHTWQDKYRLFVSIQTGPGMQKSM